MSQNENNETTNLKNQLTALNERILQAEEAGLKDALAALLHEDFTIIRASGVKLERQAFLDAVPDNANRGRSAAQPDVYPLGECAVYTVIVTTRRTQMVHQTLAASGTRGCLFMSRVSGAALPGK